MTRAEVVVARGHPINPMSKKEIEEKFRRLTARFLGRRADEVLRRLWSLEREKEMGEVLSLMRVAPGSNA